MEPWFNDAKPIDALEMEICFLIQRDFYYGPDTHPDVVERKQVEPLPDPRIPRRLLEMVRSSEAEGHEAELARYYQEVLRMAAKHHKDWNWIRHYFWLRLWLWNSEQNVHVAFPWYDTYAEMDRFLAEVTRQEPGQLFGDVDQGWELSVHLSNGDVFVRGGDPDENAWRVQVRFPQELLLRQLPLLNERTTGIIRRLVAALGQDYWTGAR